MQFPFDYVRECQKDMINDVAYAVSNGKNLIAHAPTGLGKTIASLYPSIEYAIKNNKTVYFLTSRHSQHKIVIETLKKMKQNGAEVKAVDMIGKKWLCSYDVEKMDNSIFNNFCTSMVDNNHCVFYAATRDKISIKEKAEKILGKIRMESPMHTEEAKEIAGNNFCTYELLIEAAKSSNVIVGDYFHIFSPMSQKFFRKMEKDIANSIIIVDEAHNLASRIRSHLSAKISTRTLKLAIEEAKEFRYDETIESLKRIEDIFNYLKKNRLKIEKEVFITKEDFIDLIEDFTDAEQLSQDLKTTGEDILREKKKSFVESIGIFIEDWLKGQDVGYARVLSKEYVYDKEQLSLFYNCLDPSIISKPLISSSHSTILMSGTLQPMEMYADILGFEKENTLLKTYSSPFPKENRLNIAVDSVTTLYKERTDENMRKIASLVETSSEKILGNMAIFFPSYEIMKKISSIINVNKPVVEERQGMTKQEKADMYRLFASYSDRGGAILLGVLAGSFSEGIDLPGNLLNGVVVIGLPLERPNKNTEALIDYYQKKFGKGLDYGYTYPAIVKVVQAVGRCIRTESDRGICIFADKRFLWNNYKKMLPNDMKTVPNLEQSLSEFFNKQVIA
ncbi:MAG: ATP-dependent DNA helicase [Candidatus Aenigmarchaeota archaeon]|nr:ATP-dependent DNA helicase [Candidatus Aenigmarchaeota archaeon]